MAEKLIAITIGPVFETIKLTSKPAGLWAASYLYSYISESIVNRIREEYPEVAKDIVTPYFEFDAAAEELHAAGIGYYHDHIIVRNADLDRIIALAEDVKETIAQRIADVLEKEDREDVIRYVKNWLRIYAVEVAGEDTENAVLATARYLDAIELAPGVIGCEKKNYITQFLDNEVLKESFLVKGLKNWQLLKKNGSIKSVQSIAGHAKNDGYGRKKIHNYYALVSSDGDRMGKILNGLRSDDELRAFSKNCQEYITKACRRIREFGGVVVYAGGDDLQFISPLSDRGRSLTELIGEIVKEFKSVFTDGKVYEGDTPAVSFGINIIYKKFPLYEALSESSSLLYEAKRNGRDAAVIRLEKNAGQTVKYCLRGLSKEIDPFNEMVKPLIAENLKDGDDKEAMASVLEHIRNFRVSFACALSQEHGIDNFFDNFFDNEGQKSGAAYLHRIAELLKDLNQKPGSSEKSNDQKTEEFLYLLKYIDFYRELATNEEGEEDE